MLIYGAFNAEYRRIAIILATVSKFIFVALLLISGTQYLNTAFSTVIIDSIAVLIFVIYLLSVNKENA